jgi:hypothetical protein
MIPMGAWGPAIFSDDTAADVRDEFVELVGDGLSATEATNRLIFNYRDTIADPDEQPVFWLALALTQHRLGRVDEGVRRRAIEIIDAGADLHRWDDAGFAKKRRAALQKARATLESPPPPPKHVSKVYRDECDWNRGQVVAYKLASGRFCAFRVAGFHVDRGGKGPVVEFFDWAGDQLPTLRDLKRSPVVQAKHSTHSGQVLVGRLSERELPKDRVFLLDFTSKPARAADGYMVTLWRSLDSFLETEWGLA